MRCSDQMNQCQKYLYSVQLYIHITVLFSLIMNQSLFSAHCFVCILHGSVWTHAEAESSTLHRIHTSTHFNTLHTSTLTVALSCSARKCELSSLVAPAAKKLIIIISKKLTVLQECVWISLLPVAIQTLSLLPEAVE